MNKIYSLLFVGTTLMMSSCTKNFDIRPEIEGSLALAQEGFRTIQSYNVGEQATAEIWVQKGGFESSNTAVNITIDETLLDSLNQADNTSYKLLPSDCYSLTNTSITMPGNERLAKGEIKYDPAKIYLLSGYDNVKYILPLRATSQDLPFVNGRSITFIGFKVSEPTVTILNAGVETINIAETKEVPVRIGVPFISKWDITCQLANNQAIIDDYNLKNGTYFSMLPANDFTAPTNPVLTVGTSEVTAIYKLNKDVLPGNYILPIQLSNVTADATLKVDNETSLTYCIIKEGDKLSKADWTIVSATTEEPTGEPTGGGRAIHLIDGNTETFWHSKWQGGSTPLPYEIVIDMKHSVQIAQVELLPRGRNSNNPLKVVSFEASMDGSTWDFIGKFSFTNQDAALKYYVKSAKARFIKLVIPDEGGNGVVAAIRELDVRGTILD